MYTEWISTAEPDSTSVVTLCTVAVPEPDKLTKSRSLTSNLSTSIVCASTVEPEITPLNVADVPSRSLTVALSVSVLCTVMVEPDIVVKAADVPSRSRIFA